MYVSIVAISSSLVDTYSGKGFNSAKWDKGGVTLILLKTDEFLLL
jgi:hypothetical protein